MLKSCEYSSEMKNLRVIGIAVGVLATIITFWYLSRPVLYVSQDTPLWGAEYDASCESTIYPGPSTPLGDIRAGARLRVLWTAQGKDYRAFFVFAPGCPLGWVLYGQNGIVVSL